MIRTTRNPSVPVATPSALRPFRFFLLLFATGLLFAVQPQAFAASRTWTNTNAGTATWNRSGNWNPQAIPGSGDTAVINNTFTAVVSTGVTGNYTTLNIGTTSGGSGNVSITGGTLNAVNISPQTNIGQTAGGQGAVTMTAGTWSGGTIAVGFSGTGTLNLSGGALGSLGGSGLGINTGAVGTATVSGGTWTSNNDLGVGGSGTGTLNLSGTGVVTLSTGKILIAGNAGSTGTLNLGTGAAAGTANTTTVQGGSGNATVNFNQSGIYTFAPALTGNMTVNAIGAGTTTLTADSNYTGNTTVTNGTLLITGNNSGVTGTTTVQTGATLGGTGIIGGDVIVQNGGTLSPGQSAGLLTLMNAVTMDATSTLEMQLAGTGAGQFDQLHVGGTFAAGGTLDLNVSYAAAAGDTFLLFSSGGYDSGSFTITTNLAGGLTWNTSNLASTGFVSIVPEPTTWALLSLGLVALAVLARRGRQRGALTP